MPMISSAIPLAPAAHAVAPSPLHQFRVEPLLPLHLGHLNLTVTNQALWTGIAVMLVIFLLLLGIRNMRLVPGRGQAAVEALVGFAHTMTKDTGGEDLLAFFPLILTVFLFVGCLNLTGMIPFSFTATSQITTTGYMAVLVFVAVMFAGLKTQGLHFFSRFVPQGAPVVMWPLIVPIEIISFLARPITLAVRLAANMVAGHILLKMFATFCIMLLALHWLAASAAIPLVLLVALTGLEVFVAALQAYIFTVLTCVYLNDAMHSH